MNRHRVKYTHVALCVIGSAVTITAGSASATLTGSTSPALASLPGQDGRNAFVEADPSFTVEGANSAARAPTDRSQWIRRPSLHLARAAHEVATVDGRIFVLGGFDPLAEFQFDSVEGRRVGGAGTWRTLTPMTTGRSNHAAATLGGIVYAIGGISDAFELLDTVETFDPRTGSWGSSTSLPVGRARAGAAALGGLLYVAGGAVDDVEYTASMVAFDPRTRTWNEVASMPTARAFLRLVAVGGHLYAIGGTSNDGETLATVERYDPNSNTWAAVASMNERRGRAAPGVVAIDHGSQRLIVVVGGCQTDDPWVFSLLRSTEVYDPATGRWRTLRAQLPEGRCNLVSALDDHGGVLAIGGFVDDKATGERVATSDVHSLDLN